MASPVADSALLCLELFELLLVPLDVLLDLWLFPLCGFERRGVEAERPEPFELLRGFVLLPRIHAPFGGTRFAVLAF